VIESIINAMLMFVLTRIDCIELTRQCYLNGDNSYGKL